MLSRTTIRKQKTIRFIKVGRTLHLYTLFAMIMACYTGFQLLIVDYGFLWMVWLVAFVVFINQIVFAQLDGFSRYQNYKQVKDQLFLNGYQVRLLKSLERSSCQREAAILAADELNLGSNVRNYYRKQGYRWYHIIPDFVFKYPLFFFSSYFWRTTFFTPYYRQKVDFDAIDFSEIDLLLKGNQLESAA